MKEQSHTGHFFNDFDRKFTVKYNGSVSGIIGDIYATEILQISNRTYH